MKASIWKPAIILGVVLAFNVQAPVVAQDMVDEDDPTFEIMGRDDRRIAIPFELVNNLIIIEASINNSRPLKFILDSGAGRTLISTIPDGEEMVLTSTRMVSLAGLGEGEPVQAFYSEGNTIRIMTVKGDNLDIVFLKEDIFKLSSFMGTDVHGIMGYDLFANFAVEIDYLSKHILLYDTEAFAEKFKKLPKHRRWYKIPIDIKDKKPYINVAYKHDEQSDYLDLRLLIDTGSSNAFSLYDMTDNNIHIPKARLNTLIGVGLSGNVNGYLGRVKNMKLGDFIFNKPVVAFPDSLAVREALELDIRNGSLGGEVLRRFKVIFHYKDGYLLLRKNKDYRDEFQYNRSGVEVNTPIPNFPLYIVSNVREGSPAAEKGIKVGDIIQHINGNPTGSMSLNEVISYLQRNQSSSIQLGVLQGSTYKKVRFRLFDELEVDQ